VRLLACWLRYRLGWLCWRVGRYHAAVSHLTAVLDRCADHDNARWLLAWVLTRLVGYEEEAIAQYRKLVERMPNQSHGWFGLGFALQRLSRHQEAIEAFKAALDRDLNDALAYYNIAESYIALGELQSALDAYRRVVNMRPDYAEAIGNLGATLGRLGHWPCLGLSSESDDA
jgi:tetratricopeptide (TPR) repeat protein